MAAEETKSSHVEHVRQTDVLHDQGKWWNWRVLMNLIIVGLAFGMFGYDNAFVSPLISLPLFVEKYQGPGFHGALVFTARNLDLIVTVPLVGSALGSFTSIPLQRYLGRKKCFLLAYSTMCIPGSILQLFAPNLGALVVGRFWNYFGIAVLSNVGPLYLSELVPAHARARAVGCAVAGISAVAVVATVTVWGTSKIPDKRQYVVPLAIQVAAPAVLLLLSFFLTESPTWLLRRGRVDQAKKNLILLRGGNSAYAEVELAIAATSLRPNDEQASRFQWLEILKPANLERTLSCAALFGFSQVSGQVLVFTYATVILIQSGVEDPFEITVIIFLLMFAGTAVGPFFVDKFGRRTIALFGYTIILGLDIAAGGLACAGLATKAQRLGLAALSIIFAFVNSVSFQSIIYVLPTEIPTARLREPSMTWAMFWSYTTAIITTFAVPQLTAAEAGGLGAKAYLVFAGCMVITLVWTYFYLPETANRTLAEIDELYELRVPKRRWAKYHTTVVAPEPGYSGEGGSGTSA